MNSRFTAPNLLVGISMLAFLTAACTAIFGESPSMKLRKKIIKAALGEPFNAPRVDTYWNDVLEDSSSKPANWCGAFVLWAMHQAGIARNVKWKVGVGFLSPEGLHTTLKPQVGDVAYFNKNQHEAIVQEVHDDGTVTLINGNGTNGHITISTTKQSNVTAFYSIQPLVDKALA
jgi:hypothetical protein